MVTAVIIIVVIAVLAAVVVAVVTTKRRRGRAATASAERARVQRPEPPPMRGLEDALNQVTDRSGTTMAARLDAEGAHVDDLRDVDDTGPLLRRALDHVTPPPSPGATSGQTIDDPVETTRDAGETSDEPGEPRATGPDDPTT